jgi:N-acyl homoserine lactone hydrolase
MCHARELEAARAPRADAVGYLRNDWDLGVPIATFDGQHDVFGDGRLTLIPVPGHTPGMTAAHAVLDRDGAFLLASDAVPVSASLRKRYAPRNTRDVDQYLRSLDEISRLERGGAMVLFGHDDAQWRRVRRGADAYE